MIEGRFFSIPQSPSDLDRLRCGAKPLSQATCPRWLEQADSDYYRYLGNRSAAELTSDDLDLFLEEIRLLETAGLVVDRDRSRPEVYHVYIRSAPDYDIWSIGIYAGRSLWNLQPAAGVTNPVLTRDDVTDVSAVLVADPFMVQRGSEWFMFFELLNWRANKGEIGLATSHDGLHWSYQQRVLVEPFHLSYPHVFEHNGEYYMVPETRQSGSVRLYRATSFPTEWELQTTLIEGCELTDASLFCYHGHWWMFAGDGADGRSDALRLYGAARLNGPWSEHPSSPLVRQDPKIARPAGRVVVAGSTAFRLAQNCKRDYGREVRAFEVLHLDRDTYREREIESSPVLTASGKGWNSFGMHHLDVHQTDDGTWLACVDGWTRAVGDGQQRGGSPQPAIGMK